MEEPWQRFISILRSSLSRIRRDAASRSSRESPAAPTQGMSPASPAKIHYVDVSSADAIAQLCVSTGSEDLDFVHTILIDLIQKKLIRAVYWNGALGYLATEAGHEYVNKYFGEAVEQFLGVMFGDF